jgi:cell division protein FtsI (penicillin-binding protein 3)
VTRARPATTCPRSVPAGSLRRSLEAVQRFRLDFAFGALLVLFGGLLGRLAKIQVLDGPSYRAQAQDRQERRLAFRGLRGRILDAHGRPLVTSRRVFSVAADPQEVREGGDVEGFARRVAQMVDQPEKAGDVHRRLAEADPACRYRMLFPRVEDQRVVEQVAGLAGSRAPIRAGLRGLIVEEREVRTYVNGDYAAHVLGRAPAGNDGAGACGVEGLLRERLAGDEIRVPVRRDGASRILAARAADPSWVTGRDVRLTLDIVVQHHVEKALDAVVSTWSPELATAIVLDPSNGHVVALANRPTFDPRREAGGLNLAVCGRFEPGSLFKPFTVAYALAVGVVRPDERVPLPARQEWQWRQARRVVGDSHESGEWDGAGTVVRIIQESSNTGVAELAWRLGPEGMADLVRALGFLRANATGLCVEEGRISARPLEEWNPLFPTLGVAYGQGIAVSPLRLAASFAAFARDDAAVVKPTLLPGRGGREPDLPPVCATLEHLALVREGLARCVDEGTASDAFRGFPIRVAGKTGTAEQKEGGRTFNICAFLGYAPLERPRVVVLVMAKVDELTRHPTAGLRPYGGTVAAPAVRTVIEQALPYLEAQDVPGPARGAPPPAVAVVARPPSPSPGASSAGGAGPAREDDR